MTTIIDLEAEKDRRVFAEIDADQAHWEVQHHLLIDVMIASQLPDASLTSATLRALLDTLTLDGASLGEAKERISGALKMFR